jgi:FkbM family methyltransferase
LIKQLDNILLKILYIAGRFPVPSFMKRYRDGVIWLTSRNCITHWPEVIIKINDGRLFNCDLRDTIDQTFYFFGVTEPAETTVFKSIIQPGDAIVDIGANVGWYTTLAAMLTGQSGIVYAFEPVTQTRQKLNHNINLNINTNHDNIVVYPFAVGDQHAFCDINIYLRQGFSLADSSFAYLEKPITYSEKVEIVTLDDISKQWKQRISFVKCDTEGFEINVLRGSRKFISQHKPIWLLELSARLLKKFNHTPDDIIEIMSQYGYKCLLLTKPFTIIESVSVSFKAANALFYQAELPDHNERIKHIQSTKV